MTVYKEPSFPAVFIIGDEQIREFDKRLIQVLAEWESNIKAILDTGIALDENMDVDFVSFTSNATPDTEDTIAHTLGRTPSYMFTVSLDKGAVVYKSGTTWTASNIYVKTNTASTAVTLMLF